MGKAMWKLSFILANIVNPKQYSILRGITDQCDPWRKKGHRDSSSHHICVQCTFPAFAKARRILEKGGLVTYTESGHSPNCHTAALPLVASWTLDTGLLIWRILSFFIPNNTEAHNNSLHGKESNRPSLSLLCWEICWCKSGRCRGSLDHLLMSRPCAVWVWLGQILNISFLSFSGWQLYPPNLWLLGLDETQIIMHIWAIQSALCPMVRHFISGRAQNQFRPSARLQGSVLHLSSWSVCEYWSQTLLGLSSLLGHGA